MTTILMRRDELRKKIFEEAVKWADELERENSKDERIPRRQSNYEHRVNQSKSLQLIRALVHELHDLEREIAR